MMILYMQEKIPTRFNELDFISLEKENLIHITLGDGDKASKYVLLVEEASIQPWVRMQSIWPHTTEKPLLIFLGGSGKVITTPQSDQTEKSEFKESGPKLVVGEFLTIFLVTPDAPKGKRLVFNKPGQEISEIVVDKDYSE